MDKVTYSTDTTAQVPGAALSAARGYLGATGNSTAGYFGGGPGFLEMDKVTYSSDTTAAVPGANLSYPRFGLAASSARANALPQPPALTATPGTVNVTAPNTGYFGGGSAPGVRSTMDKVTYSTDTTVAAPGAALSAARYRLAATGNSTAGYFGGGQVPGVGNYSTMDKVTYSSDTTAAVPLAKLSSAREISSATGSSTAGYFGGGYGFPSQISTMDKVTYSSDTTAALPTAGFLSVGRTYGSATGNSTAGYFGGGYGTSTELRSTMDKLTYSTDTTAQVPGASLSAARYHLAATGNSTAGYFGGGTPPSPGLTGVDRSTMDKVTYATDTTAAVPGAFLSTNRCKVAATGNSNAGYFGGGASYGLPLFSRIDKVTYSNDTTAAVPSASLSVARSDLAASSARANALPQPTFETPSFAPTPNTGYFGGGFNPGGTRSTMDKVTYSTDTTATVTGAALSAARYGLAATGSLTAGYFGGGFPGPQSTMDKVTYSTDTTAAVPGAALSVGRFSFAATGSSTAGYFGGGVGSAFPIPNYSTMDKVTYASDTTAAVPGAALSAARTYLGAASARANALPQPTFQTGTIFSNFGYFGGGIASFVYSTMDKVTYASDTTGSVNSKTLPEMLDSIKSTLPPSFPMSNGGSRLTSLKPRHLLVLAPAKVDGQLSMMLLQRLGMSILFGWHTGPFRLWAQMPCLPLR